jgi:chemotaxis protein MotA
MASKAKKRNFYSSFPDPTTIIGTFLGVFLLLNAIGIENGMKFFWDPPSLIIVLGGTMAASLVHFPVTQLIKMFRRLKVIFFTKKPVISRVINEMVSMSEIIKIEGKMSLVKQIEGINEPFLRHGLQLIADKVPSEEINNLLKEEINATLARHVQGQTYFDTLAKYSPGFGLLGTLIGLIMMLSNLTDPESIGPNMGMALITTFYGVLFSNLLFSPLSGRLEILSLEEAMMKEMMLIGIMGIALEDAPLIVKEKMLIYLSSIERKKYAKNTKKK